MSKAKQASISHSVKCMRLVRGEITKIQLILNISSYISIEKRRYKINTIFLCVVCLINRDLIFGSNCLAHKQAQDTILAGKAI